MGNEFITRKINFSVLAFCIIIFTSVQSIKSAVPRPDHVVICLLENHSYQQIIGSSAAPYINQLVNESANLQEYYGLTHPSQPNYLMLFSGSNQGETTDNLPSGTPWTTPNLGGSLINAGFSFTAYSEGIPSMGSTVGSSGAYARKHCPWVNWQGTGTNQIPVSSNQSMNAFPTDYNLLPDVSFVIPDQNNDMHNGSDPNKITVGDTWVKDNLQGYIDWAKENNSLFILTFDEDNFTSTNRIVCLFTGEMVRLGNYYLHGYDHYDLLHTLEEMYGLPNAGNSANAISIEEIWLPPVTSGIDDFSTSTLSGMVYPNPVTEYSQIVFSGEQKGNSGNIHLLVYDIEGRLRSEEIFSLMPGTKSHPFRREGLSSGLYTYQLMNDQEVFGSGKVVVE